MSRNQSTNMIDTRFGSLCEDFFSQMTCSTALDTVKLRLDPTQGMLNA